MKKKIFLVSALVAMAMGVMFVGCKDKNAASDTNSNGCTCTFDGGSGEFITKSEMQGYGASTCSELAAALRGAYASHGMGTPSINCH